MLPRALPRDVPDYHERQAAHFRALAETTTTRRVKTRLLQETEQHELHAHISFSAEERLRHRDFDSLSADEWRSLPGMKIFLARRHRFR